MSRRCQRAKGAPPPSHKLAASAGTTPLLTTAPRRFACRREEVAEVYNTPLLDLVYQAASVHRMYNDPSMVGRGAALRMTLPRRCAPRERDVIDSTAARVPERPVATAARSAVLPSHHPAHHHNPSQVQRCTLLSIKTGGCPENCGYCSQSSHWSKETGTKAEKLMNLEEVYEVRGGTVPLMLRKAPSSPA